MPLILFRRNPLRETAELAYRRIVEQAREPGFFGDLGVPDTVDGRFELFTDFEPPSMCENGIGATAPRRRFDVAAVAYRCGVPIGSSCCRVVVSSWSCSESNGVR